MFVRPEAVNYLKNTAYYPLLPDLPLFLPDGAEIHFPTKERN